MCQVLLHICDKMDFLMNSLPSGRKSQVDLTEKPVQLKVCVVCKVMRLTSYFPVAFVAFIRFHFVVMR